MDCAGGQGRNASQEAGGRGGRGLGSGAGASGALGLMGSTCCKLPGRGALQSAGPFLKPCALKTDQEIARIKNRKGALVKVGEEGKRGVGKRESGRKEGMERGRREEGR